VVKQTSHGPTSAWSRRAGRLVRSCRRSARLKPRVGQTDCQVACAVSASQIKNIQMPLRPFALERYFALYETVVPFLFSSSDCEPLSLERLLTLADQETLERWNRLHLGYTDSEGLPALRREIARLYVNVSSDDVVVVVPEEGILLTMLALLRPRDHVITMFPGVPVSVRDRAGYRMLGRSLDAE